MDQLNETSFQSWMNELHPDMNNTASASPWMMEGLARKLAGGEALVIDFTILSMVIVALALLMIVETIRHKIDSLAHKTVFFGHVLEMVYRELSTLGIVEAIIFLVHHYATINITKERVFAEVHFTIFFVAIINAIQSTILYFLALRVAEKQWTKVEAIDIDHYVAIRREYEVVDAKLLKIEEKINRSLGKSARYANRRDVYEMDGSWIVNCFEYLRYSSIKRKHKRLLVQVRFHEMRVHFIEFNQLHHKFRVSEYLKLSLNDVFEKLVHISPAAWLSLVACANVALFSLNLLSSETKAPPDGTYLKGIYLAYGIFLLLLSVIVARKIRYIFFRIMRDETWITRLGDKDHCDDNCKDMYKNPKNLALSMRSSLREITNDSCVNQLHYFWFDDPQLIVAAAQFMQFAFAIPFAVLLVFNDSILVDNERSGIWDGWYIIVPIVCYSCFVWLWSHIIPQFTQCTSLGELVKRKYLVQIESKLRLETANRKRQEEIDHIEAENLRAESKEAKPSNKPTAASIAQLDNKFRLELSPLNGSRPLSSKCSGSERLNQITHYVKNGLPEVEPSRVNEKRPRRRKTMSDGVASMRLFAPTSSAAKQALQVNSLASDAVEVYNTQEISPETPKQRRKRAASAGVMLMRAETDLDKEKRADNQEKNCKSEQLPSLEEGIPACSNAMQRGKQVIDPITGKIGDVENNQKTKDLPSFKKSASVSIAVRTWTGISDVADCTLEQKLNQAKIESTNMVSFSIPASSIAEAPTEDNDDDFSDGVPDIAPVIVDYEQMREAPSFEERLQNIYLSFNYRVASTVFGTMLAFFILTFRMDAILLETCTIDDNQNNWNIISRTGCFWLNVVLLCLFIIESLTMCILFGKRKLKPDIIIAGAFDLILSGICLGLLLWAELERCCECTDGYNDRSLAQENGDGNFTCSDTVQCCPKFGTRLCGGIGNIEPCTAFIVLRVARFMLGKKLHIFYQKYLCGATFEIDDTEDSCFERHTNTMLSNQLNPESNIGAISDLWVTAITKHPDIVAKHGVFSGALLEAMLGIKSLRNEPLSKTNAKQEGKGKCEEDLLGNCPDVQSYIEAGKLRKPSIVRRSESVRSYASSIHEPEEGSHSSMLFENDEDGDFTRPASVLIRSMRRCQCKLLPLLDEWTTVDIVLTKHEIVWFDASKARSPHEMDDRTDNVRGAMKATKGGKGLRLCDVAAGRTVLGHMPVTDIDNVKVQRLYGICRMGDLNEENDEENSGVKHLFLKEYWEGENENAVIDPATLSLSQETQWQQSTEDRLKIHSTQGPLFLARFFTDLRSDEVDSLAGKNHVASFAKKPGALLWCQSISHLCGNSQLKQRLPHFGEERDQELIDFVEVLERH
eukprot:CAMPEP_0198258792 /NCGR_PEP_ID=MMETSP1447-20131203/8120_1 /TAXON_ID=420782 /ORGANISM="Chaetoceros dichaeta, Strain CCMP1751" /LENGTH=1362 /DNA_ID=CAMNT_0043946001 /DNA_START=42 /DNA_END=4130 /DNA_ORIENTATION=+